jgi:arsenical pump membrane protein
VAYGQLDARRLRGEISWPLFPFVAGLLLLVRGIENIGLAGHLADALVSVAGIDPLQVTLAGVFGAGLGTNLTNNVPAALVLTSALAHVPDGPVRQDLVYGVLVGVDVGPNLTTVGSLATMLWLLLLRRRGLEVSSWEYFKIGVLVTPPMLLAAAGALWLTGGR